MRRNVLIGVVVALVVALALFFGGYKYGQKQCKPCPQPIAEVKKKAVKKPVVKQAVAPAPPAPAPAPAPQIAAVPNVGATKLVLRVNIVEWAPVFQGKSLMSRDIGPVIQQGLVNGTVVRTKEQLGFLVNGASILVQNGSAIVNPGPIGPETVIVVQPANGMRFASPPNGLPFFTNPGELNAVVQQGVSEIWLNFILAPAIRPAQPGAPKGLPPFPLFLYR